MPPVHLHPRGLDNAPRRVHHPTVQTDADSAMSPISNPANIPTPTRPGLKSTLAERAKYGSDIAKLLRLHGKGDMSKEELVKRLEGKVRSGKTPVQYLASISSLLADLQMWKRQVVDDKSQVRMDEMLSSWKREDDGAYAGLMNQAASDNSTICQPVKNHASSPPGNERATDTPSPSLVGDRGMGEGGAQAPATDRPGGSPQQESGTEALNPLSHPNSPEKLSLTVDSNGVIGNTPTPQMWEEE